MNHVCLDYNEATHKALEIATKIGEKGPIAIRAAKSAISRGMETDLISGLLIEEACTKVVIGTEDRNEGLLAFAEKRKPVFHGK